MNPMTRLRKALADGICVPYVGAGASMATGAPGWTHYLRLLCKGLPNERELLTILEKSEDPTEFASLVLADRARHHLPPVRVGDRTPTVVHQALAHWHCPLYFTSNFDTALEAAIEHHRARPPLVLAGDELEQLDRTLAETRPFDVPPVVVKVSSTRADMNPGRLGQEDFAAVLHRERAAVELVKTVLRSRTVAFVGCGMRDPILRMALEEVSVHKVGNLRHVALLPAATSVALIETLARFGVDTITFAPSGDISLSQALANVAREACARPENGAGTLILFEPGSTVKLASSLSVLARLKRENPSCCPARLVVLTWKRPIAQEAGRQRPHLFDAFDPTDVHIIHMPDSAHPSEAVKEIAERFPRERDYSILVNNEYAVGLAAEFVSAWNAAAYPKIKHHSGEVSRTCRDKRAFRAFCDDRFSGHGLVFPIRSKTCRVEHPVDVAQVEKLIGQAFMELAPSSNRLVIKPPDAAGSIGVRPVHHEPEHREAAIRDFVGIFAALPVSTDTARCDVNAVIVDEYIDGEEFSVESRRHDGGAAEALAVHWKVDIDRDSLRFFERLFVTLPIGERGDVRERLTAANANLIAELANKGLGAGVFHAEFRVDGDGKVRPLEVGLRPGGGMVSDSTRASVGIDLQEALMRFAVGRPQIAAQEPVVVASGLVFADRQGVLQPLQLRVGSGTRTVPLAGARASETVRDWLQWIVQNVPRTDAKTKLDAVLSSRDNAYRRMVSDAFDAAPQVGLRVRVESVHLWCEPGTQIQEEEATYLAGVLIRVDDRLDGHQAVAEAVAAMEVCLGSFVVPVEPSLTPIVFSGAQSRVSADMASLRKGSFSCDDDAVTFAEAVRLAIELKWEERLATEPPSERAIKILDLGAGAGRPVVPLLKRHPELTYVGIELLPENVREGYANLYEMSQRGKVVSGDVRDTKSCLAAVGSCRADEVIVAANLPYLPFQTPDEGPIEVNGGPDGLALSPHFVLAIADGLGADWCVLNMSSVCDTAKLFDRLDESGWRARGIVGTLARLGPFALQSLSKRALPTDSPQIIFSLVLHRRGGALPRLVWMELQEALARTGRVGAQVTGVVPDYWFRS